MWKEEKTFESTHKLPVHWWVSSLWLELIVKFRFELDNESKGRRSKMYQRGADGDDYTWPFIS